MQPEYTSKEFSILSYIDQNSDATQRDLSEHVGVSLGTINILMKRLVKKGLVKIERMQPNSVKYFLTPRGIANKIERTYGYIVRTYRELVQLQRQIGAILVSLQKHFPSKQIWVYGPEDEFFVILDDIIHSDLISFPVQLVHDYTDVLRDGLADDALVLVWREEETIVMEQSGFPSVNILQGISYAGIQG